MAVCAACGGEDHKTEDCPDDTEGRQLARGRANQIARFDMNLAKRRPRLTGRKAKKHQ